MFNLFKWIKRKIRRNHVIYSLVDLYRGDRELDDMDDRYTEQEAVGLELLMRDMGLNIHNDRDVELYINFCKEQEQCNRLR
jgi:hypothetical protein